LIESNKKDLAQALTSEAAAEQLKQLKKLSPRSEKFIRGFGTLTAQILENQVSGE
jgi:hypothetical protein